MQQWPKEPLRHCCISSCCQHAAYCATAVRPLQSSITSSPSIPAKAPGPAPCEGSCGAASELLEVLRLKASVVRIVAATRMKVRAAA